MKDVIESKHFFPTDHAKTNQNAATQPGFWRRFFLSFWNYTEETGKSTTSSFKGLN